MSAQVLHLPIPQDDVVRLAQDGDTAAFDRLYEEHIGRIYALCLRMSGSRTEAESLAQDVFVRLWQQLPSFRGASAFSSWLHRLAVNVVVESWRASSRRAAHVQPVADLPDGAATAVASDDVETRLDLERAIAALPNGARLVLVLHDIEGYTHEDIAQLCGTAVGTTKAQLHRARSLLRESLTR